MMLCCLVLVQNSHVQTVLSQSAEICHTERLLPTEENKELLLMFIGPFNDTMSTVGLYGIE